MTVTAPPDSLSDAARRFLQGPKKLLIGGEWRTAVDGRTFESIDPATGEPIAEVAHAGAADVDAAVARGASRVRGRQPLAQAAGCRARAAAERARRSGRGARAGAGGARVARQRQAGHLCARDRHRPHDRPLPLLRRLADQDRGRGDPGGGRRRDAGVHAQGAGRRGRPDHPVELPADDGRLEAGAGARRRLHGRAQAGRADAADGAAARRACARGGLPRRRPERRHRRRRDRRGDRRPSGRGQDLVHRLDGGRSRDRREGGPRVEARDARAGRQVAQHHPPRRQPEGRDRRLVPGHLLQRRPGLQRRARGCSCTRTSSTRSCPRWRSARRR